MLKNQITFAIEQITLQGMSSKIDGNTRISASLLDENSHSSHEGLVKEYEKLQIKLKQLKVLEKRIQSQSDELAKEENSLLSDIQRYNNLETLRDEYARKYEEVGNYLQELKDKKRVTQNVVKDAEKRNQLIKVIIKLLKYALKIYFHLHALLGNFERQRKVQANISFRRKAKRLD